MILVRLLNPGHIKCSSCADLTTDLLHKGIYEHDSNNALQLHPENEAYLLDSKPLENTKHHIFCYLCGGI